MLPHEITVIEEQYWCEMKEEMGDWVANEAIDEAEEDTTEEDHAAVAEVLSNINHI